MKKDRNHPKTLTTKQKETVTRLLDRFGDQAKFVKRGDLKKACQEILGTVTAPAWITRNKSGEGAVRIKGERGRYDLTKLAHLEVHDPVEEEKPARATTTAAAKKKPTKKTATKAAPPKKKETKKEDPVKEEDEPEPELDEEELDEDEEDEEDEKEEGE